MKNACFLSIQIKFVFVCWSKSAKLTFALKLRIINVFVKIVSLSEEIGNILSSKFCKRMPNKISNLYNLKFFVYSKIITFIIFPSFCKKNYGLELSVSNTEQFRLG